MILDALAFDLFQTMPIRRKTAQTYRSMYKSHIKDQLGNSNLRDICRRDVQRVISQLPPQTAAMTLAVLKSLFREAVASGLVEDSPAANVKRPRIQVEPRKFLTVEELRELDFVKFNGHVMFLAMHGLRWGEALALTKSDIRSGRVHVTKSIHGPTKTKAGLRSVPYMSDFEIFPRTPKAMRAALKAHGVHIHSLRHTYAYLLKSSGVHVTTAQQLMGHADPKVTLGIYTQFRDNEIDEAGELIRGRLSVHKY